MRRVATIVVLCFALCVAAGAAFAEANREEVKSSRMLVPDFSKTSGGMSPALSPDGNTLAYVSDDRWEVWIIHGVKDAESQTPEPWKLEYSHTGGFGGGYALQALRYLDWSPDGKRLAIAFTSGPVYVAQNFDFSRKTAEVKALGPDPGTDDGTLHSPRWSPDGKKLLVARTYLSPTSLLVRTGMVTFNRSGSGQSDVSVSSESVGVATITDARASIIDNHSTESTSNRLESVGEVHEFDLKLSGSTTSGGVVHSAAPTSDLGPVTIVKDVDLDVSGGGKVVQSVGSSVSQPSQPYGVVSVVDVESGAETIIARDAACGGEAWTQPWSPDGKSIVYASGVSSKPGESIKYGIWVADVDTGEKTQITKDERSNSPGWAPKSDRVAMSFPSPTEIDYPSIDFKFNMNPIAIWIMDTQGRNRKQIPPPASFSKAQIAAADKEIQKLITDMFKKEYGDSLPPAQEQLLRKGKLTYSEMQGIALLTEAKKIGGEFQRRVEDAVPGAKGDILPAFLKATEILPEKERNELLMEVLGFPGQVVMPPSLRLCKEAGLGDDNEAVWSPDGKKLAFVRKSQFDNRHTVCVTDVSTGKIRRVFTSDDVACISWTGDSQSIVLQAKRAVSLHSDDSEEDEDFRLLGYADRTLGRPEVWILTLK